MYQPSLNDNNTTATTLQQDVPVSIGCCNRNRSLLLKLAWLKLVLNLMLLLILIFSVYLCFIFGRPPLYILVLLCIIIFIDMVDIVIVVITIISIHGKHQEIMEMYTYSIYIFGPIPAVCFLALFIIFGSFRVLFMYISIPLFLWSLMIHVYLIYVMKNEVRMMRSSGQCPL